MCGIFGIAGHPEASNLAYLGLYALQHRGQESAGIVSTDGNRLFKIRKRELAADAFDTESLAYLRGPMAVGHVRYSTTGENVQRNVQPFIATGNFGTLALAHNGNLTNFTALRRKLEGRGSIFQSTMDTEVILHLAATAEAPTLEEKIEKALSDVEGAYSLLFLNEKELIAVRDPRGFRPLCFGWLKKSPVFASETCAFDLIGAKYEREVEPGEMLIATADGKIRSRRFAPEKKRSHCVFEQIYFARPDSTIFGLSVYQARRRLGHELAREHRITADVVTPVPDSGLFAALGFSEESGIPFQIGFVRNHYIGRTFIEPRQAIRDFGVRVKLNPVRSVLQGKRVVMIDDSIVRGTTSQKIVKMIRDVGAKEISLLLSSPPFVSPCVYGIDTPTKAELIASRKSIDEIRRFIGVDYLGYLSLDGIYRAIEIPRDDFCDACFTGNYPTPVEFQ
jgi:amidophosphoribosyltransferase